MEGKEVRKNFVLRLNRTERQLLEQKAENCGLSLSEYLRRCGLQKQIGINLNQINSEAYLELGDIACRLESITTGEKISINLIKSMAGRLRKVQRKMIGMGK